MLAPPLSFLAAPPSNSPTPLWTRLSPLPSRGCRRPNSLPRSPPSCHRSEEHTSELQSRQYLVCRLLLETTKGLGHSARNLCLRLDDLGLHLLHPRLHLLLDRHGCFFMNLSPPPRLFLFPLRLPLLD